MDSEWEKRNDFIREHMGDKPVTDVEGIGGSYRTKLAEKGFHKAYQLYVNYLLMEEDCERFKDWLKRDIGLNINHAKKCSNHVKELFKLPPERKGRTLAAENLKKECMKMKNDLQAKEEAIRTINDEITQELTDMAEKLEAFKI